MTTKELESYLKRVADSIELTAELQKTRGELKAVKDENEYLRRLVAQKLKQSDVMGLCSHCSSLLQYPTVAGYCSIKCAEEALNKTIKT